MSDTVQRIGHTVGGRTYRFEQTCHPDYRDWWYCLIGSGVPMEHDTPRIGWVATDGDVRAYDGGPYAGPSCYFETLEEAELAAAKCILAGAAEAGGGQ